MMFTKMLKKKLLTQVAVLTAPLVLVGCSSVPDAANPVEWYRSSVEYFSDDEADAAQEAEAQESNEKEMDSSAPSSPKKVESGFKAAPKGKYAEPVTRQGEVVNPLGDEKVMVAEQAPAPKAAPTEPVEAQPLQVTTPTAKEPTNVVDAQSSRPEVVTTQQAQAAQNAQPVQSSGRTQDTRSVSEIFSDNIAQTRPTQTMQQPRTRDTMAYGGHPYETVVVSSSGVDRQSPRYMQPAQNNYASLTSTVQTDARDTMTSAMMMEPSVVKKGRAQSLSGFNPAMFSGSFQVATIQFANGSAKLSSNDIRILKEVVNIHRQQGGVIRVVGHASSRTQTMPVSKHREVNTRMSISRADRVAQELLRLGMTGDRLFVGGVSDTQPLYQEVMPSGEAGNRRTEIFVDY
jgi:flagellar motor protein MotB